MPRYDAVIVGASYAGMAAAAQMPGRRLLVIERHDSVVTKHRGGLGLLLPVGERVEIRGDNLYLKGLELFVEGGVRQRFSKLEMRGLRERFDIHLSKPLVLLNEGRVKGALLRRIREIGAEVQVGSAVREVDTDGREVRVRTGEEHQARVLVGADGVHSIVRRSMGIRRDKLGVLFQREAKLNRLDVPAETLHVQVEDIRNLFFAFPLGDGYLGSVIQVVGSREVPDDLEERLEDKLERLGAGRLMATRSAIVRHYAPATQAYRQNVVLTGDALAAYGMATITGALTMGTLAGRAVHRYLAGSRYALPEYQTGWKKESGQLAIERLRWTLPLLQRVRAHRVDRLFRATRGSQTSLAANQLFWRLPAILLRLLV